MKKHGGVQGTGCAHVTEITLWSEDALAMLIEECADEEGEVAARQTTWVLLPARGEGPSLFELLQEACPRMTRHFSPWFTPERES